tara:strand:- start:1192 stop:2304 length:1113 start_codon:yes stop_codon:yes gene_type:complete
MNFTTLYGKSKDGKTKQWTISVIDNKDDTATIFREYGFINMKMSKSIKLIESGKNIGKANETTSFQQACSEAQSLWNKQSESGYVTDLNTQDTIIKPMLAMDYRKCAKSIQSPFYLQPKLDGVRLLCKNINGSCKFYSRTGKEIHILGHLIPDLINIFKHIEYEYIDGEFYSHDIAFPYISGIFRRKKNDDTKLLESIKFHVFDTFSQNNNDTFSKRFNTLKKAIKTSNCKNVICVETTVYNDYADIKSMHDNYINKGYEGIMIRNIDSIYNPNHRSVNLQKYKEFIDKEFEIVGGEEAQGNDLGTVVFICKNASGLKFNVRPRGSRELRIKWLNDIKQLIGKQLTVRYQELSSDDIPRFPVGIEIRDYE